MSGSPDCNVFPTVYVPVRRSVRLRRHGPHLNTPTSLVHQAEAARTSSTNQGSFIVFGLPGPAQGNRTQFGRLFHTCRRGPEGLRSEFSWLSPWRFLR